MRLPRATLVLITLAVLLAGCEAYPERLASVMGPYRAGDARATLARLDRAVDGEGLLKDGQAPKRDRLLWLLERGKARFEAGDFEGSRADFDRADEIMTRFRRAEDKVDIPSQAAAVLWNDTVMSYRGRLSDRVLLRTYQALNLLALGDVEESQVYLRLAYQAQQDAVARNADRIAKARGAARERAGQADAVMSSEAYRDATAELRAVSNPAYAPFANPLTSFLSGLVLLATGDASNARVDLERTLSMSPGHPAVRRALEDAVSGADAEGVYVLFERGLVGGLAATQIPIPQPFTGLSVITIPRMEFTSTPPLSLDGPGMSSATLASFDAVRAVDIEGEMPGIIIRQIISTGIKEGATYAASRASDEEWVQILALIAGSAWKAASAGVDTRSWRLLGSDVELVRLDTPSDGVVDIDFSGSGGFEPIAVDVAERGMTLLWIRSADARAVSATSIALPAGGVLDRVDVRVKRSASNSLAAISRADETRGRRPRTTPGHRSAAVTGR